VWHRTGDAGFLAEDGHLYLTGRANQMIIRNGDWIAPFLWEDQLSKLPGIAIGTILEKERELVVVLEKNQEVKESTLPDFRNLKGLSMDYRLVILKKIPRDPRHNSKIDYAKLMSKV